MEIRDFAVEQAVAYLSASVPAIQALIYKRELPLAKIGKRHIIDRVDLDKILERKHEI